MKKRGVSGADRCWIVEAVASLLHACAVSAVASITMSDATLHAETTSKHHLTPSQFHGTVLQFHARNTNTLTNFTKVRDCGTPLFEVAKIGIEVEQGMVQQEVDHSYPWALADAQNVAVELNNLAAVEASEGCSDLARATYLEVIETYIGTGYEAMRQRAQIGLDDLRSGQRDATAKAETIKP